MVLAIIKKVIQLRCLHKVLSINDIEINQNIIKSNKIASNFQITFRLLNTKEHLQIANSLYKNEGENKIILEATSTAEDYQFIFTDVPLYAMSGKLTTKEYTRLFKGLDLKKKELTVMNGKKSKPNDCKKYLTSNPIELFVKTEFLV